MSNYTQLIQILLPIITAVLSSALTYYIANFNNRKNKEKHLDDQLDNILKIAVQYPYLEMENFTNSWTKDKNTSDNKEEAEKYQRYDIYTTMVFNYMERYCEFHQFNIKRIQTVDIKSWIAIHREIWNNPITSTENHDGYPEKFKCLIKELLQQ